MTIRHTIKSLAERAIVATGATRWAERRHRADVSILAYHNIVPDGFPRTGDTSLHLALGPFRRQLDYIGHRFEVVPLSAALAPPSRSTRPRAAITFDDAYVGAVGPAVEELARRGLPATIFVAPAVLGHRVLWWDALAQAGSGSDSGFTAANRAEALVGQRGEEAAVHAWARSAGWTVREVPDSMLTATEEELRAACRRHDGLVLGSHSWSHPNLVSLAGPALEGELRRPLDWLQASFDRVIAWLAYPYGLSSPDVAAAARRAGYGAALRVSGGLLRPPHADLYAIPRINIPAGISDAGFALRVSGVVSVG
jgi:peptidoglycan/xylan/chitin deacetylase (PgdA/CDA1 family)